MRPEPSHRTTKRRYPGERPPVAIRTGAIRDELDARSDGSEAGYRAVIMRDLKRYWQLIAAALGSETGDGIDVIRELYTEQEKLGWDELARDGFVSGWADDHNRDGEDPTTIVYGLATFDALERAHILVEHAGLSVDAALVAVGLVKEEK